MSFNVVVTGANRGIGLSFCKYYHNQNFNVFGVCRQSSSELNESATKVIENVDIASPESCKFLLIELSEIKIDILINNAGILTNESLTNMNYDSILKQIYQGSISPFECQNVPVLERFKFSINFAKREAASSGEISPFPPIISVETKPG